MKPLAKNHRTRATNANSLAAVPMRIASVASAKANLTTLLREVEQDRVEITVMRRGVPVARIAPIEPTLATTGFGWMRGSVQELGDITGPSGESWGDDEDLA